MNSFIKKIVGFLFFSLVFYFVMIPLWKNITPVYIQPNLKYQIGSFGHMFSRIQEVKKQKGDVDILFLGSSHSYRGFDPRNFKEKKTFNLGSNSQTPIQTKILLERYLEKVNPRLIIYEVYPGTFSSDGVESSMDLISNDKNDVRSLKMAFQLNNIKTYNTLVYAKYADFFNWNKDFKEPIKKSKDTYISGGFVEMKHLTNTIHKFSNKEWHFKDNQVKAFNECIAFLKKKKIKVILVYAPITKGLYQSYSNNDFVDHFFSQYQLEYYNFNRLTKLNDTLDFYDSHHLNTIGVKKFNKILLNTLKL